MKMTRLSTLSLASVLWLMCACSDASDAGGAPVVATNDPLATQFEDVEGEWKLPNGFLDAQVRPVPVRLVGEGSHHQQMTVREYTRRTAHGGQCGKWTATGEVVSLECTYTSPASATIAYDFTHLVDDGVARIEVYQLYGRGEARSLHPDDVARNFLSLSESEMDRERLAAQQREEDQKRWMREQTALTDAKNEISSSQYVAYQELWKCTSHYVWNRVEGSPDEFNKIRETYGTRVDPLQQAAWESESMERLDEVKSQLDAVYAEFYEAAERCKAELAKWQEES